MKSLIQAPLTEQVYSPAEKYDESKEVNVWVFLI